MKRYASLFFAVFALLALLALPTMAQETSSSAPPAVVALDIGDVISIVVGFLGILVGVFVFASRNGNNPRAVDAYAVMRIENAAKDRDHIDKLERTYETTNQAYRTAFDTLANLLKTFAPVTPFKADDALAQLLADIQTRGKPVATAPLSNMEGIAQQLYPPTPPKQE